MAGRCCAEGKCYCALEAGDNITITGTGYANNPYVITGEAGGGGGGEPVDLPPGVSWVRYDAVDGWPATRPDLPADWICLCINEIDTTPPPTGAGQFIAGFDVVLLATPIP